MLSVSAGIDDPPTTIRAANVAIEEIRGVAPTTDPADVEAILSARSGADALSFYWALRRGCPHEFVGPLVATTLADDATEVLYACRKLPCPAPAGRG